MSGNSSNSVLTKRSRYASQSCPFSGDELAAASGRLHPVQNPVVKTTATTYSQRLSLLTMDYLNTVWMIWCQTNSKLGRLKVVEHAEMPACRRRRPLQLIQMEPRRKMLEKSLR